MTIEEIYQNFDMVPLTPDDPKLHRDLFGEFLKEMSRAICLQGRKNKKYLLPGHKGAGKSTFLNLLADDTDIRTNFLVVHYSINAIGNPYDFTHYDFLYSLALKVAEAAIQEGVEIDERMLDQIKRMVGIIQEHIQEESTEERRENAKGSGEIELKLPQIPMIPQWLRAKVYGALQLSSESRKKIRKFYRIRPQELMNNINDFLTDIAHAAGKRLLFLVDDMDKIPLKESFELFESNREFLEKPQANILYTVNIALTSSSRYARISTIGENKYFPSLKLRPNPSRPDPDDRKITKNRQNLEKLLECWCPGEFIQPEAVSMVIEMGGGNTEQTLRLLWYALDHVVIRAMSNIITRADVELAVIRRRNEYQLNQEHIELLGKVRDNSLWMPEKDEDIETERSPFLELIYNMSLFEYINGEDRWRYPNPILLPLLNR